jgi:hypothetical protein
MMMRKNDLIEILSAILLVCGAVIAITLYSPNMFEGFAIKWTIGIFFGALVLGVFLDRAIRRLSVEKQVTPGLVKSKARKILERGTFKNKKEYWFIRQMLYKFASRDPDAGKLYLQIQGLDLHSEDLIDHIRVSLNEMKANGNDRAVVDELYKGAKDTRQVVKRKYESALISWGLEQKSTTRGLPYYDLTNYEPF